MSKADFFKRRQNRNKDKMFSEENVVSYTLEIPEGYEQDLPVLLDIARAHGIPKGNHNCGIFQIQTDKGIWNSTDGKALRKGKAVFKTWAQLEEEEKSGN